MGFLARELNERLQNARVDKVTQPDDDLLILNLRAGGVTSRLLLCATPGYARVHLTQKNYENPPQAPMFCMLARKHLLGGRLLCVEQLFSDRLLLLTFSSLDELGDPRETLLYFEAMGKHCNLTMVQDGKILDSLRHVTLDMSRVRQMLPGLPFVMPPRQDKLSGEDITKEAIYQRLSQYDGPLSRFLFHHVAGLGADTALELASRVTENAEERVAPSLQEAISGLLANLLLSINTLYEPTLLDLPDGGPREVLPFPFVSQDKTLQKPVETLSLGIETLYFERDLRNRFAQRAGGLRRSLTQALERAHKKLVLIEEDQLNEEQLEDLRIKGELLTASLHQVQKGAKSITLDNYYTGDTLTVELDETQSPAQNAQRYFKKYRKAHTARKLAGEQKEKANLEIAQLEEALFFLEDAVTTTEISEIRQSLSEAGLLRRESGGRAKKKDKPSRAMTFYSKDGFQIKVGRNSAQNEALLKGAALDDVWLHAKDIPGSHVLVVAQGKKVPGETLLLAAKLACFYSKARGAMTQVDYTQRRFVKKTPGAGPGLVHYTGEKSLMAQMSALEMEQAALIPAPHPESSSP